MHLHETEWEMNSFLKLNMQTTYFEWELWEYYPELNMCLTYLSGSHVDVILVLYVADIFEWEQYECYPKNLICA